MKNNFPARLHVVFAAHRSKAVVFRRGPSKEVCTFLWDRQNDSFTLGQWLKGRIYERRVDLSPDGKYLIYFAMNGKWGSETGGSWTAISIAPWLKAIELHAKGDCWEGGGLFLSRDTYWLNDSYFDPRKTLIQSNQVKRTSFVPEGSFGAECTGVFYRRLLRDGWLLINESGVNHDSYTTFEKSLSKGWLLRKIAHEQVGSPPGKGCYWDEHELINKKSDIKISGNDWEWAELDQNTIVWACQGCLYRSSILSDAEIGQAKLLYDFNPHKFEKIEAPY